MRSQSQHLNNVSRTPAMACGVTGPSSTLIIPCLLDIVSAVFGSFISLLGPLSTTIGSVGTNFVFNIETILLGIRNVPWKVAGPII